MDHIKTIRVRIWGRDVGGIAADPKLGTYAFQYYPDWVRSGADLSPLSMPLAQASRNKVWTFPDLAKSFAGLPGLISDALPDDFGNALIDAWLSSSGASKDSITILDRLAYMGSRSMGALEFLPDNGPHSATEAHSPIAMRNLVEEARALIQGKIDAPDAAKALQHLIQVGTSAGGARAKAVIAWNPTTNAICSGQFDVGPGFEHWLVKFDGIGKDTELGSSSGYGRIEYAYHLMATKGAGMTMAPCRLLEEGGRAHFMTRRFDRDGNAKHHVQSLCGMAHLSYKFRDTHAYEQYFLTIKELHLGDLAMQEAFRRMAFNVAARNQDDHTKNFAFMLTQGGKWSLTPAYDVTFAYNPEGEWTSQHLMSVAGKFKDIGRADLLAVAERFAIPNAKQILDTVNDAIRAWPEFAREAGVGSDLIDHIGRQHVGIGAEREIASASAVAPLPKGRSRKATAPSGNRKN